jgi:VanZ family protein
LNLSRPSIIIFRISLTAAILGILILATTPLEYSVVSGINDKLNHIFAFFILALLADFSFTEKKFSVVIFIPLFCYGLTIETMQHFLPYRMFSLFDVAANAVGLLIYRICRPALNRYFTTDINNTTTRY